MLTKSLLFGLTLVLSRRILGAAPADEARSSSGEAYASREYFYVGGNYVNTTSGHLFVNQMYVEKLTPVLPSQKYPLVLIHGQAQTGTVSLT